MKVIINDGISSTDCPYLDDRYVGGIACIRCLYFTGITLIDRHQSLSMWEVNCEQEKLLLLNNVKKGDKKCQNLCLAEKELLKKESAREK